MSKHQSIRVALAIPDRLEYTLPTQEFLNKLFTLFKLNNPAILIWDQIYTEVLKQAKGKTWRYSPQPSPLAQSYTLGSIINYFMEWARTTQDHAYWNALYTDDQRDRPILNNHYKWDALMVGNVRKIKVTL